MKNTAAAPTAPATPPAASAATPLAALSRRNFLRLGGAAAGALAFPDIVPAAVLGPDAPSKRVNFALVGCGIMGTSNFENVSRGLRSKGAYPRAVCDVDDHRAARAAAAVNSALGENSCLRFHDFRDVTRHSGIDAVVIATPDHWHGLVALDAVRHGKDIYLEKPLTLTIAEGRALVDEVRRHQRVAQTGTQQRSSLYFHRACELVRNGRLGKISRVEVCVPANSRHCGATWAPEAVPAGFDYDFWLGPAPWAPFTRQRTHYQFRFILDYALGQITNFGAHDVDICQWALGRDETGPVHFEGYGQFPSTGLFTSPTLIDVTARYADGIELTIRNRSGSRVRFHGEKGWIEVSRSGVKASNPAVLKEQIGPNEIHLQRSRNHLGNFLECIRTREKPVADVAIGHRTTTICNIAMIAMQLRRPLIWNPETETFTGDDTANRMRSRAMRGPWRLFDA
ncbi:MAG: Gfo/Idh/MocA family oxidoreductase [Puniceicoccales bacterium]|jgi:predicted dehydrogenase|nr:Gfo/Idh/MocA family oxidoreductase [Puniceicoccales bacterium]